MAKKPQAPLAPAAKKRGETLQQQTVARQDLAAYNASQSPKPHPAVRLGGSGSGGAGILSARGAGSGGGSGEGGSGGGPDLDMRAFAGEAIDPDMRAFAGEAMAPGGAGPAGGDGSNRIRDVIRAGLLGATGAAKSPSSQQARSRGTLGQVIAQRLLGPVSTTGYSPGVMATRERERAQSQVAGLGLGSQAEAAALARIQQGDTDAANRAALMARTVSPTAGNRETISALIARELLGGQGAQDYDSRQQGNRDRYRAASDRNTKIAQGKSATVDYGRVGSGDGPMQDIAFGQGVERMGLGASAPKGKIQAAIVAGLGLADTAMLRRMAAEDPSSPVVKTALAQATERERKHLENQTMQQAKIDAEARKRKADEEALKFEREVYLKGLELKGKRAAGTEGVTEKQEFEGFRDAVRQGVWEIQKDGGFEDYQRRLHGYSPGVMGQLQEGAYNALGGLGNVVAAPIQALAGRPASIPAHLGVQRPPQPQATPIPPALMQPPPGIQPMAWSKALSYVQDLTPEEQAQIFGGKTLEEQQRILAQVAQ